MAAPGLSMTPSSSARSSRPAQKKPHSQSARGTGGVGSSSPQSQQPPPLPRLYKLADFEGADDVCFNPGEMFKRDELRRWIVHAFQGSVLL